MKDKDASIEQWRILIALIQKVKESEPWKQFEDMEIFALKFLEKEETVYASIMGFHQMCYGLTFYVGDEGLTDISTIAYEVNDRRFEMFITMETAFLSVYFDDQENVSWQQENVYKKLGLKKSEFPHFTVKEKHCFPDDPDCNEVDDFILYIAGLIEAIEYFLKKEVMIDFKNELFVYDVNSKEGHNEPFEMTPRDYMPILSNDEEYLNSLSDIECNDEQWEMEFNYINQGMERDDGRLVNVRFAMIASISNGNMLSCIPLEEDSDEIAVVLDSLFQLIEKMGKPLSINIANARLYPLIGPSCDYLGIDVECVDEFIVIDEFLEGFYEYANSEEMA